MPEHSIRNTTQNTIFTKLLQPEGNQSVQLLVQLLVLPHLPQMPSATLGGPSGPYRSLEVPVVFQNGFLLLLGLLLLAGQNLNVPLWSDQPSGNSSAEEACKVGVSVLPGACSCCCRTSVYIAAGPPGSGRAPRALRLSLYTNRGHVVGPPRESALQTPKPTSATTL